MIRCAYCGKDLPAKRDRTDDRVVPDGLLPRPLPLKANLIIVKACPECNSSFSPHEEALIHWLVMGEPGDTQEGYRVWKQKVERALDRNAGLRRRRLKDIQLVNVVTPGGVHLGQAPALPIDARDKEVVMGKIARGLYFWEYKEILDPLASIQVSGLYALDQLRALMSELRPGRSRYPGTFQYWCLRDTEGTSHSVWLVQFYTVAHFLAVTQSPGVG